MSVNDRLKDLEDTVRKLKAKVDAMDRRPQNAAPRPSPRRPRSVAPKPPMRRPRSIAPMPTTKKAALVSSTRGSRSRGRSSRSRSRSYYDYRRR